MKEEIEVFVRKPMIWFSLILFACSIIFTFIQLPDTSVYDALYDEYQESVEAYRNNYFLGKIPSSDATEVLGEQWSYLTKTVANVFPNYVKAAGSRVNSSLFQDEQKETQSELEFEENRLNSGIAFVNIYQNDHVLKNNMIVYTLLLIGIISIISLFYDDIENGTVKLFRTLESHLSNIFLHKWFVYILWMFLLCGIGLCFDLLCTKGNYTIYDLPAFQNTFCNFTVQQYLMWKYLNCFFNCVLLSFLFIVLLLLSRNHVTSIITTGLIIFVSYLSYGNISDGNILMVLKYANIYQWLFADIYEYSSIYRMTFFIKIFLCIVLSCISYFLYINEICTKPLLKKKISLRSTDPCVHIMREVYAESKGILAIMLVLLFGIYNLQQFQISKGSAADAYQEFKNAYLGEITEDTYQRICEDYDEISEAYEEAQDVYQKAAEISLDPETEAMTIDQLYMDNALILSKANKMEYISNLKSEYETAMELGTKKLIDDRGGNLILMKEQTVLRVESLIIIIIPLLAVCLYHCALIRKKERYLLINTSSLGLKVTRKLNHMTYFVLIVIDVITAICMHVYKVSTVYTIDYTNTLNDLLLSSVNIPLWAVLLVTGIIITFVTYLIILLLEKIMNKSVKIA